MTMTDYVGSLPHTNELFIGGRWIETVDGRTLSLVSPIDDKPFARVAAAGEAELEKAVAQRAFAVIDVRDDREITDEFGVHAGL